MKKKTTAEDLINKWLGDYHNTSLEQIMEEHPDWAEHPDKHTRDFYDTYKVTKEQHDEWRQWAYDTLKKEHRMSKRLMDRSFGFVYLNTSPSYD